MHWKVCLLHLAAFRMHSNKMLVVAMDVALYSNYVQLRMCSGEPLMQYTAYTVLQCTFSVEGNLPLFKYTWKESKKQ